MVRFGYADAKDPAQFALVDESIDGGLSRLPITNGAAYMISSGREIKVRYVNGGDGSPGDTKGPWSVWVDKIKIISANRYEQYPFAVIVVKHGFRVCRSRLAEDQWPYDLTSAVKPENARPTPVECDAQLSPIRGKTDFMEYPAP